MEQNQLLRKHGGCNGQETTRRLISVIKFTRSPSTGPVLSHFNPVHIHSFRLLKIILNAVFPTKFKSPNRPPIITASDQNWQWSFHRPFTCYISFPPDLIWFYQPNNTCWTIQITKFLFRTFSRFSSPLHSHRFSYPHYHPAPSYLHCLLLRAR